MQKLIQLERRSGEGCVVEHDNVSIEVVVHRKPNGRIRLTISINDSESLNVYRINKFGVPENKKDFNNVQQTTKED